MVKYDHPISIIRNVISAFLPSEFAGSGSGTLNKMDNFSQRYNDSSLKSAYSRSIRAKASKYILQFPMITSQNVSFDSLNVVRKNLELRNTSDIITYLNNQPLVDVGGDGTDDDRTNAEFALSDIHKNYAFAESIDPHILKTEFRNSMNETFGGMFNTTSLNEATLPAKYAKEKNLKKSFLEDSDTARVLLKTKNPDKKDINVASQLIKKYDSFEGKLPSNMVSALKKWRDYYNNDPHKVGVKQKLEDKPTNLKEELPLFTLLDEDDKSPNLDKFGSSGNSIQKSVITSKNIKQMNDYQPVYASATRTYTVDGKSEIFTKNINFAVKMVTHSISSNELVKTLSNRSRNTNFLSMIVRWTSGEIKLFSDIIFNVKASRELATNRSSGGRALGSLTSSHEGDWLQRMTAVVAGERNGEELAKKIGKQRVIPNAALVLSREELDKVRYASGIDYFAQPQYVKSIMSTYLLVDFVVIDEPEDSVYFYNVYSKDFDRYQLSRLETVVERADTGTPNKPVSDSKLKSFLMGVRNASK